MRGRFLVICISLIISCQFASCRYDVSELSAEEKYAVDTIFNRQIHDFRKQLDSTCLAEKDTLYKMTVDSLKKEGMKEIEMLLMKNHVVE